MYKISKKIIIRETVLNKNNYKILDTFLEYTDYENYIINLLNDPVIYESLLVANPKFILNISKFDKKSIVYTLTNYLSRMVSRATPFGIFSSVGLIGSEKVSFTIKKFIRPSSEWLLELIEKIESNPDFKLTSKYKWNRNLFESSQKIKVNINSGFYKKSKLSHKTISKSQQLDFIKNLTYENFVSYRDIVLSLEEHYETDCNLISKYINQVIEEELLLSEMRAVFRNFDLSFVIDKIEGIEALEPLKNKLINIQNLFAEYVNVSIGDGSNILKRIYKEMSFIPNVSPIKIDLKKFPVEKNKEIFENLDDKLNAIFNIEMYDIDRYPYIERYIEKFEERYGYYEYVPLLQMMDFNEGIGNPYSISKKSENSFENIEIKKFIREKLIIAIKNNDKIVLSREELSNFYSKSTKYPPSIELFFTINSNNQLVVLNDSAADRKGKSLGRFLYMFHDEYDKLNLKDNFVNIVEFPRNTSLLNVSNVDCRNTKKLIISFNNEDNCDISLNDILVKLNNGKKKSFQFYDKNTREQLEFSILSSINFANTDNFSYVSRFLLEATAQKYINPLRLQHIISEVVNEIGYSPDIEFDNIIIYPKRWIYSKINTNDEKQNLIQFLQKWEIPNLIIYTEDDKYLYLNLSNEVHFDILFKKILNNPRNFIKIYDQKTFNNKDCYTSEYIVTLEKENSPNSALENITVYQNDSFILGDEWISIKYYDLGYLEKEFLGIYLKKFSTDIALLNMVDKFFYISYADPDRHIRVRLHISDKNLFLDLLREVNEFNAMLRKNKIANRIVFDTYTRETERYGGKKFIQLAESLFHIDSVMCLQEVKLLHTMEKIQFYFKLLENIFKYLFKFGLTLEELMDIFEFRDDSSEITKLCREIKGNNPNLLKVLLDLYTHKKTCITDEQIEFKKMKKQITWEAYTVLVRSLVHMHLNRLLIDNETELIIIKIMYKFMENLKYLENNGRECYGKGRADNQ